MSSAAIAVAITIINSLTLACMAEILGYTVGRGRAVKNIEKEEILFAYRYIAIEAMYRLKDDRLEHRLQEIDEELSEFFVGKEVKKG